ncbi:MAG TPA: hypothetical protein DCR40_08425 [Prolixibacteraceae bacterium]|nr:hypothetical protein [Prolixibacteraceae bacterium]
MQKINSLFVKYRFLPCYKLEEKVNKLSGKVMDQMKLTQEMNLAHVRMKVMAKSFSKHRITPIISNVSAFSLMGLQIDAIVVYIICKHVLELYPDLREKEFDKWREANEKADIISIQMKEVELAHKDYLGIRYFDSKKTIENPEKLAQAIVDEFEAIATKSMVITFWKNMKSATNEIVLAWQKGYSISEIQANVMIKRYKYFVPFPGWNERNCHSIIRAKGRTVFAETPLAYLQQIAFKAIGEQIDNEVKTSLLNLVGGNYGPEFQKFYQLKQVYYLRVELPDGSNEWEMTLDKPSEEMFDSGKAKTKIYNQYHKIRTPTLANEHEVFVKRPNGDFIIEILDKMLPVAQAMNKLKDRLIKEDKIHIITPNQIMKKPTSTFWICFSIILVGLIFCGTYYFVNKDNGRYEYQHGLVIDKKTGEAKQINIQ